MMKHVLFYIMWLCVYVNGLNISHYCCDVDYVLGIGYLCTIERCCPNWGKPKFLEQNGTTVCKCVWGEEFVGQTCPEAPTPRPTTNYTYHPTRLYYPTLSPATTSYPTVVVVTRKPTTWRPSWPRSLAPTTPRPTTQQPTIPTSVITNQKTMNSDTSVKWMAIVIPVVLFVCVCSIVCFWIYKRHRATKIASDFVVLEQQHSLLNAV